MRHLKEFKIFESVSDIEKICKDLGIKNFTVNTNGYVDVEGHVDLIDKKLTKIPIKFGSVGGSFNCSRNNLKTLEGSPSYVGGEFSCRDNKLVNLEGSPDHVGGRFYCYNNELETLEGCPKTIGDHFSCRNNKLINFEGFPSHVGGEFLCEGNPVCEIWKLFRDFSKIELFNDYDIIRGDSIILDRINHFLEEIGKPTVTDVKGYEII